MACGDREGSSPREIRTVRWINFRDAWLLAGWFLAIATAALVAWTFLQTPLSDPLGNTTQFLRLLRAVFVVLLVLVFTALLVIGIRRAQRGEEESRLLLDLGKSSLILADGSGRIQYVTRGAADLLRYPKESLVGKPVASLAAPDSAGAIAGLFAAPGNGGSLTTTELTGLRSDGTRVHLEATAERSTVHGAPVLGVLLRDLSERDELVQALTERGAQLTRSNRDLEQFAYVASHDLQEPLRMVSSYTQLVAQRYKDRPVDREGEEFLGYAQEGAGRMKEMIDNLLAYSRLETRGRPFAPVPMEEVFDRAVSNLQEAIRTAGAQVSRGPLPTIVGDATQLVQLLQNLIANAIKFRGPQPPKVEVTAEAAGSDWRFTVKDNGIGIAEENRERIFVIFQRLHSREEYPGSGIGLSTCKKVVERHGGRIWVESDGVPGAGTRFLFTLPAEGRAVRTRSTDSDPTPAKASSEVARTLIESRLSELI